MVRKLGVMMGITLFLSGCQATPTFLNPSSPIAGHEANLYKIILYMALAVFVLFEAALIFILVRDRKRPGDEAMPQQIYGNNKLEITWTGIPILLVIALFVMTVQTMNAVAAPHASSDDLKLKIIGHQWWWEFDYTDLGIATANELHIPVDTNVQIELMSVDVIHSFWVPQLSGKTDVVPGQNNTMWLKGDEVGEFLGQCAEFCGTEHALMRFKVIVDSQEDFDAWVSNQQKPAYQPQTDAEQAGYKVVTGTCKTCHSIDPGEFNTDLVGPNLAHLFSRTTFAGGTYELNEENLKSWLQDTQAMKPGNDMKITLTKDEINNLMAFLTQLQ